MAGFGFPEGTQGSRSCLALLLLGTACLGDGQEPVVRFLQHLEGPWWYYKAS